MSLHLDGDSALLVLISSDPWVVLGTQLGGSLLGDGPPRSSLGYVLRQD